MNQAQTQHINPKHAKFRKVQVPSIDHMLLEADRLAKADQAGKLECSGNWSLGQTLAHIAFWINAPYDNYPGLDQPPALLRWFFKAFFKRRLLSGNMPRGARIPKIPGGTLGADPISTDEGLQRLNSAADRLRLQPPARDNIVLGPLSHDEWINLNLSHAALHFGYMHAA